MTDEEARTLARKSTSATAYLGQLFRLDRGSAQRLTKCPMEINRRKTSKLESLWNPTDLYSAMMGA